MKSNLAPMLAGKGLDLIFKSPELTHFDAVLVKKEQTHVIGEVPLIFIRLIMSSWRRKPGGAKRLLEMSQGFAPLRRQPFAVIHQMRTMLNLA